MGNYVKAEVDARRRKVASLLIRAKGMTVREMAAKLHAAPTTIERDVQEVRPVLRQALMSTAQDLFVDAVSEIDEIGNELWRTYGEVPKGNRGMKLAYLNSLLTVPERRMKLAQSLGIVVAAPERTEIIVKVQRALEDILMDMPKDEADRLAKKFLDIAATP